MKTNEMKVKKELPKNMTGHIVVFEDPLEVHQTKERIEIIKGTGIGGGDVKRIYIENTGKKAKCNFMRAECGFGCYEECDGRMIMGNFFKNIQDVIDNKTFQSGNTKCYPTGFIPKLFTKHENL